MRDENILGDENVGDENVGDETTVSLVPGM